jgi:lysozyme-like protein
VTLYTFGQLEDLWKQAGGNAVYAPMAAAIAMAESGGRSDAVNQNTNGTTDRGLWQINSIHGPLSTFDPMANAKAAVSISQNGTTWRPWCTAWSNARCGGTYLGDGAPYKKFLPGESPTGPSAPSQTVPVGGGTQATLVSDPFGLSTAVDHFFSRINAGAAALTFLWLGIFMILIGIFILIKEVSGRKTMSAQQTVNIIRQGTKRKTVSETSNTGIDDTKDDDE